MKVLTSYYDVEVKGDSLTSFLPYFGRAYIAPVYPTDSPLSFTSGNIKYKASAMDNKWDITIVPTDNPDISAYHFLIYNNGSASLDINSNTGDPISFSGHLKKIQ